nr:immunoglobulin light chain junction region [Macaca mulatta]MPN91485.1 immunoglobulin light chain junction region [Macaca mulatta]MPN91487.1 immunoglobulin light chain junction region [Macaca mulatta]MPN91584.1 immunoglobulin light chain junction region [Macaca mulatta]MPN91593.1 immunoglobulin light chain junction region [Macaca mulatta]
CQHHSNWPQLTF